MENNCPCGAVVTDPNGAVAYWTDTLLDLALGAIVSKAKYLGGLAPFTGAVINVETICASPRVDMPSFELADFANFHVLNAKIAQALANWAYKNLCTCVACPPATTCNTGTCIPVTPDDGFPRPGFEDQHTQYLIEPGAEIWVATGIGTCLGLKNGVLITWTMMDVPGGPYGVQVCEGDGENCVSYDVEDEGSGLQLCFQLVDGPPTYPWPEAPAGVADWYGPPACTTSDICTAVEYLYQAVRRIEFLTGVVAGPDYGVTTPVTFNLPGLDTPITGPLVDSLPRAFAAIAPIDPAQLVDPETLPVDVSSVVELDGQAYASIELTTVPAYIGSRGAGDSLVYFSNMRHPGPGWAVVIGQEGILSYHELIFGEGNEFSLPATATGLALHLHPGVEIELTLWNRHV